MARPLVPDELWEVVQPLLPCHRAKPGKRGRPPVEDRARLSESTQAELTRLRARLAEAETRNAGLQSSSLARLLEVVKQMEELRELQHSLTEAAEPQERKG